MEYRLGCMALVFALTGCFSDPPSSGSSGDGSTSSTSSGSTSGGGSESTGDAADSTGPGDSSSSGGGSGSTGFECEVEPFDIPSVNSDVVLLIDDGVDFDFANIFSAAGGLVQPGTNVAILTPAATVPALENFACSAGCGACNADPAMRVIYPYEGMAMEALATTEEYSCILREPPPGNPTTGPTRHLWLVTNEPGQTLPPAFADAVESLGLRVHLSCPMCDQNFGNVSGDLINAVSGTLGTVSNSNMLSEVREQAEFIAAPRLSCGWVLDEVPPLALVTLDPEAKDPDVLFLTEVDAEACTEDGFFVEDGVAGLCPEPCLVAQTLPEGVVEVAGCY